MESVLEKRSGRKPTLLTEVMLHDIGARLEILLRNSTTKLVPETGVSITYA
jgi:hypothetical protein